MKVKVLCREVYFDGKGRLKGEEFDAPERWAAGKIVLRQVEEIPGKPYRKADFKAPVAEPAPFVPTIPTVADFVAEEPPVRRHYRTRVMKAGDE
ncbi:MAG: hypothetical protein WAW13_00340 [Minisyncoccia bacterium]